ncbi:NAD(P)H-dependent oxidoreductase subunit E [Kutzneria chonburiensis]|uniref:NADH-quinone oxidoreductase subunit NuoE family protein n=1 Tax=Kutzneria chonburiensis TaxID=1483604 RepID=UPI00236251EE|nr:NAD(P)H-dependent oxidoreductase subunit E [Kutzneria chonburiensis]
MDLRFLEAAPSTVEQNAVDAALEGTDCGRDQLLPALHAANDAVGWISEGALNHICRRLSVPPAEAYGVATFYSLFAMEERPRKVVHVCVDLACKVNGAEALAAAQTDYVVRSPCLGVCERAPAALAVEAGAGSEYLMPELPLPQQGILVYGCCAGSARSTPPASTTTAPPAGMRHCATLSCSGRRA